MTNASRIFIRASQLFGLTALFSTSAKAASDQSILPVPGHDLVHAATASVLFGLIGIILAMTGFKLFDLITPFNLEKEICQNKNIAAGILCAAIVLGICHIIAASIS